MRAWALASLLAIAAAVTVRGVALLSEPAAWIVAGVLLAVLAFLTLTEVDG